MVTTFTYKPSLVRIDARNFEFAVFESPAGAFSSDFILLAYFPEIIPG